MRMATDSEAKVSYPYMTSGQWFGVRAKLRQSMPSTIDVDWVMAALGTSDKGARNIVPQLRAVGLIDGEGKPLHDLVQDLRDDDAYPAACKRVREALYPSTLLSSWDDPDADADKVAAWFMRNAGTGAVTAKMQAKLYLVLLQAELPSPDQVGKATSKRSAATAKSVAPKTNNRKNDGPAATKREQREPGTPPAGTDRGPNLHVDVQIHISADASDTQIDTIFKSMAKHLYGR